MGPVLLPNDVAYATIINLVLKTYILRSHGTYSLIKDRLGLWFYSSKGLFGLWMSELCMGHLIQDVGEQINKPPLL